MTVEQKGWIPIRRGAIFCSPRCGGGCTHAAFKEATRKACALAKRLGDGWKPRVWENLGWHYSVGKGVAEMHVTTYKRESEYRVYFNSAPQIVVTDKTPEAALTLALGTARLTAGKLHRDIREVERE